ncbi:hypothetical protein OE88DRAFT_1166573 [Heliocybe sulcata]|uniref:Uncharacterized protein n=1 Tax=Heliocybe sulcata TaxID=5364 RepID=A0A5C3NA51_9AGAM|nr:hypothetical protein OE88DRAFT_1166573 [Heliocybe sulcata]
MLSARILFRVPAQKCTLPGTLSSVRIHRHRSVCSRRSNADRWRLEKDRTSTISLPLHLVLMPWLKYYLPLMLRSVHEDKGILVSR